MVNHMVSKVIIIYGQPYGFQGDYYMVNHMVSKVIIIYGQPYGFQGNYHIWSTIWFSRPGIWF